MLSVRMKNVENLLKIQLNECLNYNSANESSLSINKSLLFWFKYVFIHFNRKCSQAKLISIILYFNSIGSSSGKSSSSMNSSLSWSNAQYLSTDTLNTIRDFEDFGSFERCLLQVNFAIMSAFKSFGYQTEYELIGGQKILSLNYYFLCIKYQILIHCIQHFLEN